MHQTKLISLSISLFICLSFSLAQAYSISGVVLDSQTTSPIDNVSIYIKDSDIGTVSDINGNFVLYLNNRINVPIDLNIKMIGYKEKTIKINSLKTKIKLDDIYLNNQSLELESIHIHSHNTSQISDISLSGQKFNDNLKGNIATTLSSQPNIGVNSFGAVTSKPVLRGYSGDRFLLTKDGNQMGDLSQSSIDHVITLDMSEVSEIEILRGPKSLIYGSNTIGGVINTSLSGNPKTKVNKIFRKFLFGGESFNKGFFGNLSLYIPIKDSQFNVLISNRNTGNESSPIGKLPNTYSNTSEYKLGYTKYNTDGYINFSTENYNINYGIPPSLQGHLNGVDIELVKNTFQANFHKDILLDYFNQLDLKYNFIDYEHKEFEDVYSQVSLAKKTHNLKIELESSSSIIGSELLYKDFIPGGLYYTPQTDEIYFSIYGYHEKDFNDFDLLCSFRIGQLSIKPDLNYIDYKNLDKDEIKDREFDFISSSVGIKKTFNKVEFNTWIMNTMRGPKVEELYSDGPHLGTYSYEIGNPNLKVEETYGIESSIRYNEKTFSTSLTAFYNKSPYYYQMNKIGECGELTLEQCRIEGFIEAFSGEGGWLYKYQTEGIKSLIKGLEFNFNYQYKKIQFIYDFSLVRGYDLTNDLPLSYINPDKQILILEYKKELINYKFRFSKIHDQDRLGEFESYTPSASLVDFIIGYSKDSQNITIQFNNIFNKEYYNHLSKIKSIKPEAGRSIFFNYKILF